MENENKTLVFDSQWLKGGDGCKEHEKQFHDLGFTWFHEDGDYCSKIFHDTKDPQDYFNKNKLDWLLYEGKEKKHDLFLQVAGVEKCYEKYIKVPGL